ncbi:MAG TPA: aminotransferase class I/II-fold pyridoxal phosphate-dependent enzyme [Thermoanaerobaculia bacterium]|nr:aminotransferase class I/II-fold pyridoxal phosphate-dependent enzyme [Thermoanaerobaculia bacterium]
MGDDENRVPGRPGGRARAATGDCDAARALRPETLAAQALGWWEPSTRGLVPAIHPSTTFERAEDGSYPGGRGYTRDENPTYEQAEALLAALEGGEQALLFASGMAAAAAVLDSLDPGAHVVAGSPMYWALRSFLERLAREGRIRLDLVPSGDLGALARTMRRGETRLVWVETPANPTCDVTDLEAAAAIAQSMGAVIAVDSTVATPVHTRPIALGCDLVLHSATKQLNGHSDVLAGALVCARRDELWSRIRRERASRGAVLGPFESWLLLRGMRTLYLRAPAASRGAQRVAEALAAHPAVSQVFYPGLPEHPGHEVAARQMQGGFGCLLSFRVRAGEDAARAVASRTRVIKQATSLGGVESLIEHRASIEGPDSGLPVDLLRVSIGIEAPEDLVADLEQALASGTRSS